MSCRIIVVRRSGVTALMLLAAASAAQPCIPEWDATIGLPGIQTGYVGPMLAWDDGTGERLYVGGSFDRIGGSTLPRFLARWNSTSNTWSRLGGGIGPGFTNAFVTSLCPFNTGDGEELIVGGFWADAAGVANSASLARWNGTRWANLGAGYNSTNRSAIWALTEWNGVLYIGGGFTGIGPLPAANGIASWDGEFWANVGSGYGGGNSPGVFALKVHDDGQGGGERLYAGGRFTSIGGIPGMVARWNGSTWEATGTGIGSGGLFAGVETFAVFEGDLYAGGVELNIGGVNYSVARWDGIEWTGVGQNMGGRTTCLAVWDDGTGAALFAGGTAQPDINYLAKLEGDQWVIYDGGITGGVVPPSNFPSVFGLTVWNDRLHVGGNFVQLDGAVAANGLVSHTACFAPPCPADLTTSSDPNDPTYGTPDGVLDGSDFFFYLDQFAAGNLGLADLTTSSDPNDPSYGVPDGALDGSDFFYYLDRFADGCP